MIDRIDTIVVGAGVVGLAIAREMALAGHEVVVLERETGIGMHASSRNSEVIHAGLYYPPDSLKARLCVEGREQLYAYCRAHDVKHRQLGKIIVAVDASEVEALDRIRKNALDSGAGELEWLDGAALRAKEPAVRGVCGLWSPRTGIVDTHGLMRSLAADAEAAGAVIVLGTSFRAARPTSSGLRVTAGDAEVECTRLVLAAGVDTQEIARSIEGLDPALGPPRHLSKGVYFTMRGRSPFSHLVYPVPDEASLGIHVTLDLAGQVRFGPDRAWVRTVDYQVDPSRAPAFEASIRRYYPSLPPGALVPGYAGIRSKVQGPGEPMADFVIHGPDTHGIGGLVCLYGIESPGLTASLALARHVADALHA